MRIALKKKKYDVSVLAHMGSGSSSECTEEEKQRFLETVDYNMESSRNYKLLVSVFMVAFFFGMLPMKAAIVISTVWVGAFWLIFSFID